MLISSPGAAPMQSISPVTGSATGGSVTTGVSVGLGAQAVINKIATIKTPKIAFVDFILFLLLYVFEYNIRCLTRKEHLLETITSLSMAG
jgi:hypothetical protein